MRSKERKASIVDVIEHRDGSFSAIVKLIGSSATAQLKFAERPTIGKQIRVVGAGSQWVAA